MRYLRDDLVLALREVARDFNDCGEGDIPVGVVVTHDVTELSFTHADGPPTATDREFDIPGSVVGLVIAITTRVGARLGVLASN